MVAPPPSSVLNLQQNRSLSLSCLCEGRRIAAPPIFQLHFVSAGEMRRRRRKKQGSLFGGYGLEPRTMKNKTDVTSSISSCESFSWRHFEWNKNIVKTKNAMIFPCNAALKEETELDTSSNTSSSPDLVRKELSALDAYFDKLEGKDQVKKEATRIIASEPTVVVEHDASMENDLRSDLKALEQYLDKLSQGSNTKQPSNDPLQQPPVNPVQDLESLIKEMAPSMQISPFQEATGQDLGLELDDVTSSGSYVVYAIVAINVAVYLFGLASPVDTVGMGASTLPVLYGAKVNALILGGEWWRLITPMFLHSGFLHVALSTWALLFFGPQVESVFGSLAFCMLYFLGGLCGNTFSYYFTPAATVGGTGPLFALFTAWIAYLWQNRKAIGEKSAGYGIKATALMSVVVLFLSILLPTDEWIHVGASLPGLIFGAFSSPALQLTADSEVNEEKEIKGGGVYAMYNSPSMLSLSLVFIICTALCFVVLSVFGPVAELELLENMPL